MISEEHNIWKINSPLYYNLANFNILDWPSLSCQWLPFEENVENGKIYKLILGTHAENEENKLLISQYKIFKNVYEIQSSNSEPNDNDRQNKSKTLLDSDFQILQSTPHQGDVNRARYMPQNPSLIATRSSTRDSFIYDEEKCVLTLRGGHNDEGYGLSWNPSVTGRLLTCSFDNTICSWDISKPEGGIIGPINTISGHTDKVEDICWHPLEQDIFASVSDDKRLLIWDYRSMISPQLGTVAHNGDANCVDWHSVTPNLLLTGGSDDLVHLWDRRKLVHCVHSFETEANVYRVEWAPLQETLFMSAGLNHKVHIWDIEKIGDEVKSYEEEDHSPPELVMVHPGHFESVTDLSWHPILKSTVASVAEDNLVNIWQIV